MLSVELIPLYSLCPDLLIDLFKKFFRVFDRLFELIYLFFLLPDFLRRISFARVQLSKLLFKLLQFLFNSFDILAYEHALLLHPGK